MAAIIVLGLSWHGRHVCMRFRAYAGYAGAVAQLTCLYFVFAPECLVVIVVR